MTSAPDIAADPLAEESQRKRRRIASSFWPKARLAAEILYNQVDRVRLFTQASALTYKTLFSLLPIFVLSLLVLSTISTSGGKNALDSYLKDMFFDQLGVNHMTIPDSAGNPVLNPDGSKLTLATFADRFIDNARASISNRATGLVAFGILLYGAISLMVVIEDTFGRIYGASRTRTWPRRIMLYWCVLTLGPIGVAASMAFGHAAYSAASINLGHSSSFLWISNALGGFLVSWILLLLLFRIVPDTHVNWRPALIGSFIAALSWEIGKGLFGLYILRAVRNSWYGSMALLPVFMFWIYITWSLILLGLEITYMQQYWPLLRRQFFFTRRGAAVLSDLRWVLSLGVLLHKQFRAGQLTETHHAAETLMLPNDVTGMLLEGLERAGIVHEVKDNGYALARPPESITAYDLLSAARTLCQPPPELAREPAHVSTYPTSTAVQELEILETQWAKSHALPALAGEAPAQPANPS